MVRLNASLLTLATATFAALALSACGGGGADLLPGKTAAEIEANLDQVAQLAGEGECVGAENAAQEVSAEIEGLGGVDAKLKQALREGASRLNEVVAGCEEAEPEEEVEPVETEEQVEPPAEKSPEAKKAEKLEKSEQAEQEREAEEAEETTPPPAGGKAKGAEKGEGPEGTGPPGHAEPPSGGVGPGTAVEGEGG